MPGISTLRVAQGTPLINTPSTVISQVAVCAPSAVVAVIVAVPTETAVTVPPVETVATAALLLLHITVLLPALAGNTVAWSCCVAPTPSCTDVGETVTLVGTISSTSETVQAAALLPELVLTVIIAVPRAFLVTRPVEDTVATDALLLVHVTFLLVALAGSTVAVSCCVAPTLSWTDEGETVTLVGTILPVTSVTVHVAVLPPEVVFTVIVAVPRAFFVTTPVEDTVAIDVLLLDHVTLLSVALLGVIVAVSRCVAPIASCTVDGVIVTFVGSIALTVTLHVAVLLPALVFTVIAALPGFLAVTMPEAETVATDVLLLLHVTVLLAALAGSTVAWSCRVAPGESVRAVGETVTLVGCTVPVDDAKAYVGIKISMAASAGNNDFISFFIKKPLSFPNTPLTFSKPPFVHVFPKLHYNVILLFYYISQKLSQKIHREILTFNLYINIGYDHNPIKRLFRTESQRHREHRGNNSLSLFLFPLCLCDSV